jgi:hypothetical protein
MCRGFSMENEMVSLVPNKGGGRYRGAGRFRNGRNGPFKLITVSVFIVSYS